MSLPRGPKDLATVTMPYPTATHYGHEHLIFESASPGKRAEARTRNKDTRRTRFRWEEGTAVGRYSGQVPGYLTGKSQGNGRENFSARRHER
jgi:hypothetical protein